MKIYNMAAASPEPEQKYINHVNALLDLVDNPMGMVDCQHTRGVIEDAANAFAVMIFENRRLRTELDEQRGHGVCIASKSMN